MYGRVYSFVRNTVGPGGSEIRRNLRALEESQWWSGADIEAHQLQRLRRLLRYAQDRSPFYRSRFDASQIHPDDISSLGDLAALPTLTREELRTNLDAITVRPFDGEAYMQKSGGTTGEPLQFLIDRSSSWWSAAIQIRGRRWYGVEPGDRQAWVWGAMKELPTQRLKSRLLLRVKRRRMLNGFFLEEDSMREFSEGLRRWQPKLIRAYPASLFVFARHLEAHGVRDINPRLIETTGEKVAPEQRQLFWEVFRAPAADLYSCRELLDVAYQCPQRRMHVAEPFIVEAVDGDGPVEPGRVGELAITSLLQLATPLIRYKLGDVGALDPEPCPCGRRLPVIAELKGRVEDYLILSNGRPVWGAAFQVFWFDRPEISRFQVYQTSAGEAEIRLELRARIDEAWLDALPHVVSDYFGGLLDVKVKLVERLDLTRAGKLRNVVSEVATPDWSSFES